MKINLLKLLDKTLGCLLVQYLTASLQPPVLFAKYRLLIIRPGGVGDAVLLAPAVSSLKNTYADIHITILAEQRNAGVFSLFSGVDNVLRYDHSREFFQVLRDRYDVVIDTEQWYRLSAVVARLVRAPMKIGFATNERRRMFTHGILYDQHRYEADNFLALFKPLGVDSLRDVGTASLTLPLQSVSKARHLLQPLCSGSIVVIFSGASIPEKRWGTERFVLVAKQLAEDGYKVVIVGGREDRADGDVIAESGGINLAGRTTITETAAVIARSNLVISGDSGVLHIAVGLDIPTVSLFGPSSETKWAPQGEKHIVLNHRLPCSPCSKFGTIPPCPIDALCIKGITPDEVMAAVERLLPHQPQKTLP